MIKKLAHSSLFPFFLLTVLAGLVYLPFVFQASFYRDEWYFILDGIAGGAHIFPVMFSPDRPARGLFFEIYFFLFQEHPFPYHLTNFIWRILTALSLYWLCNQIWPEHKKIGWLVALLFVIYPGYLWWVSGLEYQPMMVSLFLGIVSIIFSLKFIIELNRNYQITFFLLAGTSTLISLLLVEYAIGMEIFRLGCVLIFARRQSIFWQHQKFKIKFAALTIPALIFLVWRFLIFENQRPATDFQMQISSFFENPLPVFATWLTNWIQSVLNVSILSWFVPFNNHFLNLTKVEQAKGFVNVLPILVVLFLFIYLNSSDWSYSEIRVIDWQFEAIIIGAIGLLASPIPIILSNRVISFQEFSHYSLPSIPSALVLLAGYFGLINVSTIHRVTLTILVSLATLTHYGIGLAALQEQKMIREFWWQVYWRIPGLNQDTTLAVYYYDMPIREDFDNIWGPANLLYYPTLRDPDGFIHFPIAAISLTDADIEKVEFQLKPEWWHYRTHGMTRHFDKMLVLQQPTKNACVQIVTREWFSKDTPDVIRRIADYSKQDVILADTFPDNPPHFLFGDEPLRTWCYYYQKISLSNQREDWETALRFGYEAIAQNFAPRDNVEWLPLLRASIMSDNSSAINYFLEKIKNDDYIKRIFCQKEIKTLQLMTKQTPEDALLIAKRFCDKE
ncbi:MAG: hypothetical protein NZP74_11375 [Anaerolineales bacterium]|nr:hypothetical protein [Anaerolineales bacterium]MDW8276985.1 hypothetical protein [Anaerolineales bacterium]